MSRKTCLLLTVMLAVALVGTAFAQVSIGSSRRHPNPRQQQPVHKDGGPTADKTACKDLLAQQKQLQAQEKPLHQQAKQLESQEVALRRQAKAIEGQREAIERSHRGALKNTGSQQQAKADEDRRVALERQADGISKQREQIERQAHQINEQRRALQAQHKQECAHGGSHRRVS